MERRLTGRRPGIPTVTFSGTALKWLGFAFVCMGSFSVAILQRGIMGLGSDATAQAMYEAMAPEGGMMGPGTAAVFCSLAAVLAIPIYVHFLCQGFLHTKDIKRYILRLFACALVSEIPYDLAMSGRLLDLSVQNPLWALALGAAMLEICRMWKTESGVGGLVFRTVVVGAAMAWALLLRVQMGVLLLLLIALFHFARERKTLLYLGSIALTMLQFPSPLGLLFITYYDGTPVKGSRRLFYALYPAQLLLFGALSMFFV